VQNLSQRRKVLSVQQWRTLDLALSLPRLDRPVPSHVSGTLVVGVEQGQVRNMQIRLPRGKGAEEADGVSTQARKQIDSTPHGQRLHLLAHLDPDGHSWYVAVRFRRHQSRERDVGEVGKFRPSTSAYIARLGYVPGRDLFDLEWDLFALSPESLAALAFA